MRVTPKLICLFTTLFVVVSASLFWVKWRRENPPPTLRDLAARKRLIADENAVFRVFAAGKTKLLPLSRQEREEIAYHLWIIPKTPAILRYSGSMELYWKTETLVIAPKWPDDCYQRTTSNPLSDDFTWYQVHPATSLFLRRWLARHPEITLP